MGELLSAVLRHKPCHGASCSPQAQTLPWGIMQPSGTNLAMGHHATDTEMLV